MSSPPIWPGSPFYRKNKGVLLQGRVTVHALNHLCVLFPLKSALFFFFYLHQFLCKKWSWCICMHFRSAFPSTKGSYPWTWLTVTGISGVGVYLVCLPWFIKSCVNSECFSAPLFSVVFESCQSFSCYLSLSDSVMQRSSSFQFWLVEVFSPMLNKQGWRSYMDQMSQIFNGDCQCLGLSFFFQKLVWYSADIWHFLHFIYFRNLLQHVFFYNKKMKNI